MTAQTVRGKPRFCMFRAPREIGGVALQAIGPGGVKGTHIAEHRGGMATFTVLGKPMGHVVRRGRVILGMAPHAPGIQPAIRPDDGPFVASLTRQGQMSAGKGKPRPIVSRNILFGPPHQGIFVVALFARYPQLAPMGIHVASPASPGGEFLGGPPSGVAPGAEGLGMGSHQGVPGFFPVVKLKSVF